LRRVSSALTAEPANKQPEAPTSIIRRQRFALSAT
jgi:hypothetical protein